MEKRPKPKKELLKRFLQSTLARISFRHEDRKTEEKATQQSPLESTLPVELLLIIINKLDIIDQVCLQSTNRFFRRLVEVDPVHLNDRCRKWAICCRLEQDLDYLPAKLTCAFCKAVRPWKCFRDHKEVRVFDLGNLSLQLKRNGKELQIFNFKDFSLRFRHKFGFQQGDCLSIINAPSSRRFCTAHRHLLFTGGPNALPEKSPMRFRTDTFPSPRWTGAQVLRCWHCGHIVPEGDLREAGCLQCLCDICPRDVWVHYFRTGPCTPGGGQYKYDLCRKDVWRPGVKHRMNRFVIEVGGEQSHVKRLKQDLILSFL